MQFKSALAGDLLGFENTLETSGEDGQWTVPKLAPPPKRTPKGNRHVNITDEPLSPLSFEKTTLEMGGEVAKNTLKTSGEQAFSSLKTSGEQVVDLLNLLDWAVETLIFNFADIMIFRKSKTTLETSGEDVKLHSKRVEKM